METPDRVKGRVNNIIIYIIGSLGSVGGVYRVGRRRRRESIYTQFLHPSCGGYEKLNHQEIIGLTASNKM
jgi:hypothetical protein